ncbi:MAG: hypothetical protein ACRDZO_15255 [Egibacteraceae bacterium]
MADPHGRRSRPSRPEWAGVAHLLSAPTIAERAAAFVDRDGEAIGWPGLLAIAERLLVHAALDLWNGDRETSQYDAVTRLDDDNFARLVEALRLCRGLPAEDPR